jgi:CxxC motif-containing protein (DUF1111 family)
MALVLLAAASARVLPAAAEAEGFGAPISGLTAEEGARFVAGRETFVEDEEVDGGLGPVFNGGSCVACHDRPAAGGGSARVETRLGTPQETPDAASAHLGGPLVQEHGIGVQGRCDFVGEVVPAADVRAGRRATALFGLGLVDAVADTTLLELAARQRVRTPATAGRARAVLDAVSGEERIGRFGWKAQGPSLLHAAAEAYLEEMGVTSPFLPEESCPQGDCAALACDPVPDPEDDGARVFLVADFVSLLAAPPRAPSGRASTDGEGRRLFARAGCADCHVPRLRTGWHEIAALRNRDFAPYSDFLLHDMGALGDGIAQAGAEPREMRTAPLWGLRAASAFLHDGRAATVEQAILAHDGQGAAARETFRAMSAADKERLLGFLRSL